MCSQTQHPLCKNPTFKVNLHTSEDQDHNVKHTKLGHEPYIVVYTLNQRWTKLGAIKDESWIEGNVTMISQKNHKIKKTEQLSEYGRGNMQTTKTPSLNKTCSMKKWWWK